MSLAKAQKHLEEARSAVVRGDAAQATSSAIRAKAVGLTLDRADAVYIELAALNVEALAAGLRRDSGAEDELLRGVIDRANVAIRAGAGDAWVLSEMTNASVNLGLALYWRSQTSEALPIFLSATSQWTPTLDDPGVSAYAEALQMAAHCMYRLDRMSEALALLDRATAEFGKAVAPEDRAAVAHAYCAKGAMLTEIGDYQVALRTYETALAWMNRPTAIEVQRWEATALNGRADCRAALGDTEGATATWRLLLERFPPSGDHRLNDERRNAQACLRASRRWWRRRS